MFESFAHKRKLKKAFSDCFEPLKSVLDNVPIPMQTDRYITASILGSCRAYAEVNHTGEKLFMLLVDAVFEEVFRQNSMAVQTRTEQWLNEADDEFMQAYYHAKEISNSDLDLNWLADYAQQHFDPAVEVNHLT
ncbi:MAG: hypothetical protein HRT93_09725 [Piscirickettsiaceae bacterium]|nr:hypothetical protein [Piscirickettsiaceae bacterium]